MKHASKAQHTWIFQSPNRDGLSPAEVERLEKNRQERKKKNHTLNPNRY